MNFVGCLGKRGKFLANSRKVCSIQNVREESRFLYRVWVKKKMFFRKVYLNLILSFQETKGHCCTQILLLLLIIFIVE